MRTAMQRKAWRTVCDHAGLGEGRVKINQEVGNRDRMLFAQLTRSMSGDREIALFVAQGHLYRCKGLSGCCRVDIHREQNFASIDNSRDSLRSFTKIHRK